jgi:hypothetical protein
VAPAPFALSRPRAAESLNDWSPRPPRSYARPTFALDRSAVLAPPVSLEDASLPVAPEDIDSDEPASDEDIDSDPLPSDEDIADEPASDEVISDVGACDEAAAADVVAAVVLVFAVLLLDPHAVSTRPAAAIPAMTRRVPVLPKRTMDSLVFLTARS